MATVNGKTFNFGRDTQLVGHKLVALVEQKQLRIKFDGEEMSVVAMMFRVPMLDLGRQLATEVGHAFGDLVSVLRFDEKQCELELRLP